MILKIYNEIKTTNDWFKAYPPAGGEKQWKEGFSALEFANAVLNDKFEEELALKLGNLSLENASFYPERLTYFDDISSGPRHHDLACVCTLNNETVALCFEAKVKESLDAKLASAYKDTSKSGKSKKPQRVKELCKKLFNKEYNPKTMSGIYYQMLTGTMGTLAFAYEQNISKCFFIVYQLFPKADEDNFSKTIKKHKKAINDFIQQINLNFDINKTSIITLGNYALDLDPKKGKKTIELNIVYMEHPF